MADSERNWASKAIIDPLTEPEPSALDGPGTHFTNGPSASSSPVSRSSTGTQLSSNNPFRKSSNSTTSANNTPKKHNPRGSVEKTNGASTHTRQISTDGTSSRVFDDLRKEAFVNEQPLSGRQRSGSNPANNAANSRKASAEQHGRPRRSSSLSQRYPGDPTDQPLDMLKKNSKLASRSPHLRKKHQPRPDQVDVLDDSAPSYHHGGPYDAALLVRNSSYTSSPVAALKETNREAWKATPDDKKRDALNDHRPLDGTALVPPGMSDDSGRVYDYQEGADLMREPGADFKRWPGVQYLPEDLKGKGEPSYSIEKALKEHEQNRHSYENGSNDFELAERPRHASATVADEGAKPRKSTHSHKLSGGIRRRVGSLGKKDH